MSAIEITSQILEAAEASSKKFGETGFANIRAGMLKKCEGLSSLDTAKRLTLFYTHGDQLGLTSETRIAALGTIAYL